MVFFKCFGRLTPPAQLSLFRIGGMIAGFAGFLQYGFAVGAACRFEVSCLFDRLFGCGRRLVFVWDAFGVCRLVSAKPCSPPGGTKTDLCFFKIGWHQKGINPYPI